MFVRRTLTEPKTVLADVMFESSFARSVVSMAIRSEEKAPFCPLGRWDLVSMARS